jgi:hypothetical protein
VRGGGVGGSRGRCGSGGVRILYEDWSEVWNVG